jgi:hypothetical protein
MRAVMAKMQARNVLIPIYFLECLGGMVLTGWTKKGGEDRLRPAD